MLKKLSYSIQKISNAGILITFIVIMILFMVFVLPGQAEKSKQITGNSKSPDTSFFYTPAELFQVAADYGSEGRQYYIRNRWTFDLIYPLVYIGFLTTGISWFYKSYKDGIWIMFNLVPLVAGFFDYIENIAVSVVMAAYPNNLVFFAFLSSGATLTKWLLVSGSFLIYFWGLALFLLGKMNSKRTS